MPLEFDQGEAITYLKQFLTFNKARGMVAELALETYLREEAGPAAGKVLPGAWLISPNVSEPSRYRYAVFVLPALFADEAELERAIEEKERDRGFQSLATFLSESGIGVIVSGGITAGEHPHPERIAWRNFIYMNERFRRANGTEPFSKWPGNRGRVSIGNAWQQDVQDRFLSTTPDQLTGLTLRQAFYYGYLKAQLHKPLGDPYDADAFVVSFRGSVMPVEIKEKSPTPSGAFGLDAGRILMMLRLCLATDSNALYIIREVDGSATRQFVAWRFITLSNLIMGCSWNLQAGGAGMGGGATQTVMMAGSLFETFSPANLSEEWLANHSSLQSSVRATAQELAKDLAQFL